MNKKELIEKIKASKEFQKFAEGYNARNHAIDTIDTLRHYIELALDRKDGLNDRIEVPFNGKRSGEYKKKFIKTLTELGYNAKLEHIEQDEQFGETRFYEHVVFDITDLKKELFK